MTPPTPSPTPADRRPTTTADARHAGVRTLRRYHEGSLAFHERRAEVKFVMESATGMLILPVEPGFAKGRAEFTVFMPEESAWVMQVALIGTLIDRPEAEEACDRWRGYHGGADGGGGKSTHWVRCAIEGGKTESAVFDPEELQLPNALARSEYALIRLANTDRALLAAACKKHGAVAVADPQCVGVDPFGIDVKARFGIMRLEFPPGIEANSEESAHREVARLLGSPDAAKPLGPDAKP